MFSNFAGFWIKNKKLSFIIISLVLISGIFAWNIIPKQYNPDIVVPAYQIDIPAPGYSSDEIKNLIINPLENKLFEIEGVEHVYGYAAKDFGSIMVSFYVGEEKEKATTRIYNKINSNMDQKPIGIENIQIKAIDPDEIPIFNIAITYTNIGAKYKEDISIRLRKIALEVTEELKHINGVSNLYTIGGQRESISVKIDPLLLESKSIDILQVIDVIKKNNINFPAGNINFNENQAVISIQGKLDSVKKLQKLVIANYNGLSVYLEDISTVTKGIANYKSQTLYANAKINSGTLQNTIFLGLAKKKGTNAVSVSKQIQEKIKQIKKLLPPGYEVFIVQDEGEIARKTTNMLLINLVQSILIVIIILSIFLGFRNSLNVAISIPLTLSVIFLFALIIGDNINRITLFALILVLGMLVDDATVVVENVNRNLEMRPKTGKKKLEAIFDAIKEVELGVILSTITRLMAFGAMFFVTGMMGLYMGPIPKYAIVAMITSTFVALSINPFLAHVFSERLKINKEATNETNKEIQKYKKIHNKISKFLYKKYIKYIKRSVDYSLDIAKIIQDNLNFEHIPKLFKEKYIKMLHYYLGEEDVKFKRRAKFKKKFFIILAIVIVLPPMFGIFKMRMLPKSDQNQIYVWIDNTPDTNIKDSIKITEDINTFLKNYLSNTSYKKQKDEKIISSISYRIGEAPTPDFSNLFRGAAARQFEHNISLRINLIDKNTRELSSEAFTILLRPELEKYIKGKYPGLQIRLLEDPPGPPVRATFLLKISGEETTKYEALEEFASRLRDKLTALFIKDEVKEVYTSKERYKTNFKLILDHELLSKLGINAQQVAYTVNAAFMGQNVSIFQEKNNLESTNVYVSFDEEYKDHMNAFQYVNITSANGKKIPLLEISKLEPNKLDKGIFSDDKNETVYIFGEMGNNSVIYPMIDLYNQLRKNRFRDDNYTFDSMNFYGIKIKDIINNDIIEIKFGGERELTIDTFKDLGLAMIVAFLAIYFMMIAQFKSFKIAGVIMNSFLLGFFGVFPGFTLLYIFGNEYFSATSMIGVIALAGIVVGNSIILIEYINILLARGRTKKGAIIDAARTRLKPIFVTSLTTILGATTVLGDPVWGGLALAIIFGLTASVALTPIVIPIMLYDKMEELD